MRIILIVVVLAMGGAWFAAENSDNASDVVEVYKVQTKEQIEHPIIVGGLPPTPEPAPVIERERKPPSAKMTSEHMVEIISEMAVESKVVSNMVFMTYEGVEMTCIYDVYHDRMRIISAIVPLGDVNEDQLVKAMEANFHTSLDASYAVNDGMLYAAYIHPLSPLKKKQVQSAMVQVSNLAKSFGSDYTSGLLSFGGLGQPL